MLQSEPGYALTSSLITENQAFQLHVVDEVAACMHMDTKHVTGCC